MKKITILTVIFLALAGKSIIAMQGTVSLNLSRASSGGRLGKVKKLLASGANVNEEHSIRYGSLTPLRAIASQVGLFSDVPDLELRFIEIIKLLIKAGADVNGQDRNGWTPLMANVDKFENEDSLEFTKMLLDAGADPLIKNINGETAFDINSEKNNVKTTALLLHAVEKRAVA